MSTATLCLGANVPDAATRIERAAAFIARLADIASDSGAYPSDPETNPAAPRYTNRILIIDTTLPFTALYRRCKDYEGAVRAAATPGLVSIDIDIVVFEGTVLRPLDHSSAYFRKGLAML